MVLQSSNMFSATSFGKLQLKTVFNFTSILQQFSKQLA